MKNQMAKIAFIILSIVFVFSACMTVFAVTTKSVTENQNGIEATLNFNKQEYNANENVEVTLNVKNNNSYAVKNIQTELIVPSTIKLATGSLKQETFSLNAGESKVQEVALEKVVETSNEPTTNSPQTGDNVVVYIAMMVISASALVVIAVKKKWIHKKKVMSLVLCFTLVGAMTLTSVVNADVAVKEFTVEGTIKYDGEDVVIKGKVTYDYEVYSKVQIDGVDKGMYAEGNTVNITAEDAPEGKHFAGWTVVKGNVTLADANSSTTTFVMGKEEVEIKANYEVNKYTIEVTSGENGKVSPAGSVSVNYVENKEFKITPNTGYHIEKVEVDGKDKGTNDTYTFTDVKENHTIKATFAIDTFTISSSAGANGTITESATVNYGDSKTFTITPNKNYHIEKVEVDGQDKGTNDTYTFTDVKDNHTIKATFAINPYSITATAGANGTITESARLNAGESKTFTMTANTGYGVKDVKVDGISVGPVTSYTFENVNGNHTIEVEFATATTVTTARGFRDAVTQDGIIILANDITLDDNGDVEISKNVIIRGGGHTIYSGNNGSHPVNVRIKEHASVNIEQCNFTGNGYFYISNYASVTFLSGTIDRVETQDTTTVQIFGGLYSIRKISDPLSSKLEIFGGVFDKDCELAFEQAKDNFIASGGIKFNYVVLIIKGGTFYFDPTSYLDTNNYKATQTKDADNADIWVVTEK